MISTTINSKSVIRVVGLCGSLRPGSYTQRALDVALQAASTAGADSSAIAIEALRLPLCDGGEPPPPVTLLQQQIAKADALILATPEYCGTLSAVIKNALEWIGYDLLQQKICGLVAVAAGASADGSLNALRQIALSQGMWVLPANAPVPLAQRVFDQAQDDFSQLVQHHLVALGSALPEAVRRIHLFNDNPGYNAGVTSAAESAPQYTPTAAA